MGRNKSPVDELVDGIDAVGSILDENLPLIKSRIADIENLQSVNCKDISEIRRSLKEADEVYGDLKRAVANIDIRLEELLGTIGALARRLDQLQKSVLDLTVMVEKGTGDNELADTVKQLEDRVNRIEGKKTGPIDFSDRF